MVFSKSSLQLSQVSGLGTICHVVSSFLSEGGVVALVSVIWVGFEDVVRELVLSSGSMVLVTVTVLVPPPLPMHPLTREASNTAMRLSARAFLRMTSPLIV